MNSAMRILREPLLHFLLAGAAIFILFGFLGGDREPDQSRIVVTQAQIARMAALWERVRNRPPTAEELRGLVEEHVKEEIYYREALALGLDSDDTVIRRRLRQKMEFLSADAASTPEPSEADLTNYLERHREKFRTKRKLAFLHVYLKAAPDGAPAAEEAERLLRQLVANGPGADISNLGDPIQLPAAFSLSSVDEIARLFGQEFADKLVRLDIGTWAGPLQSGYGLHLVLVEQRVEGRDPALDEVRAAVKLNWLADREREVEQRLFERLRQRYAVTIEWPKTARDDGMRR